MEKIEGISLLVSKYKEKDAIINILTRDGFVSILGRGVYNYKNKNFVFTTPYIYGQFEIYRGGIGGYKLKDAKVYQFYIENLNEYSILISCDSLSEILLKTKDGIDDYPSLYNIVLEFFENINEKNAFKKLTNALIKLTILLGIRISINDNNFFDYFDGIFVKEKNKHSIMIENDEKEYLRSIYSGDNCQSNVDFIKIITCISFLIENKFDIKINSIDMLNNY